MKTNRMFTVVRLVVLGALMAVGNVKAADVPAFQGKFTLNFEAHWGQVTLAPGNYSFTLDHDYPGSIVTIRRGTQTVARIQAPGMRNVNSGACEIVMENGTVREVNLPTIGVSLHYPGAKSNRRMAPQGPALAQVVPLTPGSGR